MLKIFFSSLIVILSSHSFGTPNKCSGAPTVEASVEAFQDSDSFKAISRDAINAQSGVSRFGEVKLRDSYKPLVQEELPLFSTATRGTALLSSEEYISKLHSALQVRLQDGMIASIIALDVATYLDKMIQFGSLRDGESRNNFVNSFAYLTMRYIEEGTSRISVEELRLNLELFYLWSIDHVVYSRLLSPVAHIEFFNYAEYYLPREIEKILLIDLGESEAIRLNRLVRFISRAETGSVSAVIAQKKLIELGAASDWLLDQVLLFAGTKLQFLHFRKETFILFSGLSRLPDTRNFFQRFAETQDRRSMRELKEVDAAYDSFEDSVIKGTPLNLSFITMSLLWGKVSGVEYFRNSSDLAEIEFLYSLNKSLAEKEYGQIFPVVTDLPTPNRAGAGKQKDRIKLNRVNLNAFKKVASSSDLKSALNDLIQDRKQVEIILRSIMSWTFISTYKMTMNGETSPSVMSTGKFNEFYSWHLSSYFELILDLIAGERKILNLNQLIEQFDALAFWHPFAQYRVENQYLQQHRKFVLRELGLDPGRGFVDQVLLNFGLKREVLPDDGTLNAAIRSNILQKGKISIRSFAEWDFIYRMFPRIFENDLELTDEIAFSVVKSLNRSIDPMKPIQSKLIIDDIARFLSVIKDPKKRRYVRDIVESGKQQREPTGWEWRR